MTGRTGRLVRRPNGEGFQYELREKSGSNGNHDVDSVNVKVKSQRGGGT